MDKPKITSEANQIDQCCQQIKTAASPQQVQAQVQQIKRCCDVIERNC